MRWVDEMRLDEMRQNEDMRWDEMRRDEMMRWGIKEGAQKEDKFRRHETSYHDNSPTKTLDIYIVQK